MDIPSGYKEKGQKSKVCRLKKIALRIERFTKSMLDISYSQSQGNHTLFIKQSSIRRVIALIVHIDDIIAVTSDDNEKKLGLKVYLAKEFEIKYLGIPRYILGIELWLDLNGEFIFSPNRNTLKISFKKWVWKIAIPLTL